MKFTGKDFLNFNDKVIPGEKDSLDCIADIANKKLEAWLAEVPTVYGFNSFDDIWLYSTELQDSDTHKGKLVEIVKIK